MPRLPLLVGLLAALALPALPALAGPSENALLARFAGEWRGGGKMTGPNAGDVSCRLTFKTTSSGRLTYTGRCSVADMGGASFRGAIAYNDAAKRFEATTTASGASGATVGKRNGSTITFTGSGIKTMAGTASSTMVLAGGSSIKMSFKLVDKKGATSASSVSFAKQ